MSNRRCAVFEAVLIGYVKSVIAMNLLIRSPAVGAAQEGGCQPLSCADL